MTYICTNAFCHARYHYTPRCPYPGERPIELPAPGPRTAWERRAFAHYREQAAAGAFDLRCPYKHLLEEKQPPERVNPGYQWLLVFIPVAVVLAVVMLGLLTFA